MNNRLFSILLIFILGFCNPRQAVSNQINTQNAYVVNDKLHPFLYDNVLIDGIIGQAIDSCIINGVMAVNHTLYTVPFRDHTDRGGMFQGEFWGKWFTSAALAYAYKPYEILKTTLNSSYQSLISTQEPDGRISSYPREETFVNWDIWGRKYVLLGLMAYYEVTGDQEAIVVASRALDELISIAGPGKQKLTETGLEVLGSMSSTSILEPVVLVYKYTDNIKYLDFANYLVSLWSEPNAYTERGKRLIEDALKGVPPVSISSPKAYEMMSCFEGLCELYRATGDDLYLNAVLNFAREVVKREIMIVGSGSSAELWCDGAFRQTELLEQPMETCVTVTWIKLCYQLLRLTGDPFWADQMEITLYNSLLGAMSPDGHWWAYFTPLTGEKMPSPMQVPSCQSSCCVANGPRGLLTVPGWAMMLNSSNEPVINLYTSGQWSYHTKKGSLTTLRQTTEYPYGQKVSIEIDQSLPETYAIHLRIPGWSKKTAVYVNEEPISVNPSSYLKIERQWAKGDIITIHFDMRGRIVQSPGSVNHLAIMRGPIVLALDNRFVETADYNLWLYQKGTEWLFKEELGGLHYVLPTPVYLENTERYVELTPVYPTPEGVNMAFEAPFLYRYTHFFDHEVKPLVMVDFASAGNLYTQDNLFRVWLPQPIYMNAIFYENTWKILYREGTYRPEFPGRAMFGSPEDAWQRRN